MHTHSDVYQVFCTESVCLCFHYLLMCTHLLWYIYCGTSTVAHLLWHIYCGTSTVAHLLWYICCGTSAVAHLLWYIYCGTFAVAHLLWHIYCGTCLLLQKYVLVNLKIVLLKMIIMVEHPTTICASFLTQFMYMLRVGIWYCNVKCTVCTVL